MIATGSCPNQQIEVGIPWIMNRTGTKTFIVGSNYIYPRTMSKQAAATVTKHGGTILGDEFVTFGVDDPAAFEPIIAQIAAAKPDWVLSNLVADNIGAFLKAYKKAGLNPEQLPVLHTVLFESNVAAIGTENCLGHYSLATYFESIETAENREFVQRFKVFAKSRPEWKDDGVATLTTFGEGVYSGAMACRAAMIKANSAHPEAILEASRGLVFKGPTGFDVKIDPDNLHPWLWPRIGQVNENGAFDLVYQSPTWIAPEVFNPQIDADKVCSAGGRFYIKGIEVPTPRATRTIIPQ